MKTNFHKAYSTAVETATAFIEANVTSGKKFIIHEYDEDADNQDELYDLPFVSRVGKYGDYDQYAIIDIFEKDGKIFLNTIGTGEDDKNLVFPFDEWNDEGNVCNLADLIAEQL